MKYFSLFTGIGGLDYGLAKKNECVGFSEIKDSSIRIYKKHYPNHKNYGDITKIEFSKVEDFDILTGGFPCQSFSLAGSRRGFNDRRGKMIFHIYDLLLEKKPSYFVLENVKGILNHDNGRTYENILRLFKHAGYFVRVLLLNSAWYGSAQSRERVIFLGSKKDFIRKEVRKIDDTKRFRDIRDDVGEYRFINVNARVLKKILQNHVRNYELIGGYDRVGTLTTGGGCGEKLVQVGDRWRMLNVKECERLQGFSEGWTDGESLANRYFALGNAVNCNISNYLFNDYLKGLWYN